jgi:antitoxin (DNA-binding transcriptional repressor) of toxin-antitoxin stability system
MEVSITQFRREMFDLVNKAMDGSEVWVVHKGRRFRIAPDDSPTRLSRITPLEVINQESQIDGPSLLEEMALAWEKDWSTL